MTAIAEYAIQTPTPSRAVAVVTNDPDARLLEAIADSGDYDVVFIESFDSAYSHIKRVSPSLVIVNLDLEDPRGFQLLSMLKLDAATSNLPLLTLLAPAAIRPLDGFVAGHVDSPGASAAASMN